MRKAAMIKAWEIARAGQKKFGGSVKEYFTESLKMAWFQIANEAFFRSMSMIVTGANGIRKITMTTGKDTPLEAAKVLVGRFKKIGKKFTPENIALWMNLEINKL